MAVRSDAPEGYITRAEAEAMAKAAAQDAAALVLQQFQAQPPRGNGGEEAGGHVLARDLAVAIQGLTDANSRVKRLSPDEIGRRQQAKARMDGLVAAAQAGGEVPEYVLKHACFLGEQFLEPTEVGPDRVLRAKRVRWTGAPNQAMRPVNEAAMAIWQAFNESIGGVMRVDDEKMRVGAGGLVVVGQAGVSLEKARTESRLSGAPWQREREVLEVVGQQVAGEFVPAPAMPGAMPARQPHTSRAA